MPHLPRQACRHAVDGRIKDPAARLAAGKKPEVLGGVHVQPHPHVGVELDPALNDVRMSLRWPIRKSIPAITMDRETAVTASQTVSSAEYWTAVPEPSGHGAKLGLNPLET